MPGHDLRHAPPVGLTWASYLAHFVAEFGGWTALAEELAHRRAKASPALLDPQTAERGLRRLATREHKPPGKYGTWMLRHFGVPPTAALWAQALAQYHSRFADLPTSVRLDQLRLWNRSPIADSDVSPWIQVGLASVLHRLTDLEACRTHLELAEATAHRAGPTATIEAALLRARISTDEGDRERARGCFSQGDEVLETAPLSRIDTLSYRARLVGQRAYHLTKPLRGAAPRLQEAKELFSALENDAIAPFACFRKHSGLAYCTWKLGDADNGAALARIAADYAGDGGLVRFRVMALNMLSLMVPPTEGQKISERALRLAEQLEDIDLTERVQRRARRIEARLEACS